jgi:hypothetical protein
VTNRPRTVVLASLVVGLASMGCSEARPLDGSASGHESPPRAVAGDSAPAADGGSDSAVAPCLADLFSACPETGACS